MKEARAIALADTIAKRLYCAARVRKNKHLCLFFTHCASYRPTPWVVQRRTFGKRKTSFSFSLTVLADQTRPWR